MYQCAFILNEKPLSDFIVGGTRFAGGARFPAFSGLNSSRNKRAHACFVGTGPIPPGQYWIFDRQSGGQLGALRDAWRNDKLG